MTHNMNLRKLKQNLFTLILFFISLLFISIYPYYLFFIVLPIWFTICSPSSAKKKQRSAVNLRQLTQRNFKKRKQVSSDWLCLFLAVLPCVGVTVCGCKRRPCPSTQRIVQGVRVGGLSDSKHSLVEPRQGM